MAVLVTGALGVAACSSDNGAATVPADKPSAIVSEPAAVGAEPSTSAAPPMGETASERVSANTSESGDVTAHGTGIPPERRAAVFDRFTRLDDARDRDSGGAGLGLAIVADVLALHHGTVEVDDAPSGGARFTVRLPTSVHDRRVS